MLRCQALQAVQSACAHTHRRRAGPSATDRLASPRPRVALSAGTSAARPRAERGRLSSTVAGFKTIRELRAEAWLGQPGTLYIRFIHGSCHAGLPGTLWSAPADCRRTDGGRRATRADQQVTEHRLLRGQA
eukprot:scaffold2740_cov418-Prasinococcus_capsulatus_cf.AAC.27